MTYFINTNRMTFNKEVPWDEVDAEISRLELQHKAAWKELRSVHNRFTARNPNEDKTIVVLYVIKEIKRRLVRLDNKLMAYQILKENGEDEAPLLVKYPDTVRSSDSVSEIILEKEGNVVVKEYELDLWKERMEQEIQEKMEREMFHGSSTYK